MSGQRGGRILNLDPAEAKAWIARGWADPVETLRQHTVDDKPKRKAAEL